MNTIADCTTYNDAIETFTALYVRPKNEIFVRHQLATRKQQSNKSIDEFLQAPRQLAKDCNFQNITDNIYCNKSIRDAFISSLNSNLICQQLLKNKTLTLIAAYDQARAVDVAQKNSEEYSCTSFANTLTMTTESSSTDTVISKPTAVAVVPPSKKQPCFFCSNARHPRYQCPAKKAICNKCQKRGHFARVCQSSNKSSAATYNPNTNPTWESPTLAAVSASAPNSLSCAVKDVSINGHTVSALIDTVSSENFISKAHR